MGEPPDLHFVQLMQRVGVCGDRRHSLLDGPMGRGVACRLGQLGLELGRGLGRRHSEPPSPFGEVLAVGPHEHLCVGGRRQRQLEPVIGEGHAAVAGIEVKAKPAFPQRRAVAAAKRRHQQLGCRPVDVEELRAIARLAPFEHVAPIGIVGRGAHVIGDEIEHDAHAFGAERRRHALEGFVPAETGIDHPIVDHVIAVGRTRLGLEDRRGIEMADAEARQIRRELGARSKVMPLRNCRR
ncbi:hypothetical protein AUC69_15620 [Methyloceanibacter superfactus]|uniref:Uncharacterized protein n=1 Tax=Methyloceanibacter superfactus TaxID=1774969 RepID=A0A1E3VRN2_9HYPH|nr:hypothetical protein AUC69_15620 [Methyloceanibacter superfactus]